MNTNLSFSVLTANIISLLLIGTLYFSNRQRISHDRDMRIVLRMMGITAISNVADCLVFYLDSSSGTFVRVLVFLSGSWLFLGNLLIGYIWARFIMTHMDIPFTDTRRKIYRIGGLIAGILLIINIFYPVVFSNKDGVYQRGPAYSIFLIFAVFYIADSLYLYAGCRKKVGTLKLFPVQVFLVPIVFGVVIQALFVEIAITWTSIAVAIAGDEFVVMLNTTDEQLIKNLIERAKKNFEDENKTNDKPYQLSASMGYGVSNLSDETMDDFMSRIDKRMYQDKAAYYEKNERRKRGEYYDTKE